MSTTATTPTTIDPVAGLNDFPDRFSPIIVKELRQGLRQASFVILFLFLQTVLALAVISSLFAISPTSLSSRLEVGNTISGFFFGLFGLAVLVLQPLRGLNSISSEIKENTIDLLLLTRLDSWRIAFGKWLSLVTQSALLLIAILPYLMMRYFLGGMNLLAELGWLAFLFLVGAMFCAMGVGMSAVKSAIIRSVFVVVGVIVLITGSQGIGIAYAFGGRSGLGFSTTMMATHEWVLLWVGIILLVSYLTFAFLEFAATRIAPPAENRATRKRLISIIALILIPAFFTLVDDEFRTLAFISIYFIAAFTMVDALSENPLYTNVRHLKNLPMLRPGWPSGAIFGLCILALCMAWCGVLAVAYDVSHLGYDSEYENFTFLLGAILLAFSQPALLLALFRNRINDPPSGYLTALMGSTALGLVIMLVAAVADAHDEIGFLLFPFFPVLTLPQLDDPSTAMTVLFFMVSAAYLVLAAIIGRNAYPVRKAARP